jgi:hypothetical protein
MRKSAVRPGVSHHSPNFFSGTTVLRYRPNKLKPSPPPAPHPTPQESSWNCDGELLTNNSVRIRVKQAAVDVFARGVELLVAPLP